MRETRPSGSDGGVRFNPLSLPLSAAKMAAATGGALEECARLGPGHREDALGEAGEVHCPAVTSGESVVGWGNQRVRPSPSTHALGGSGPCRGRDTPTGSG